MEQKEKTTDSRPSYLQIRYLLELDRIGNSRGFKLLIAEACGVSHVAVVKYLNSCRDSGDLTEDYRFTEKGRKKVEMYRRLIKDVEAYLYRIGSTAEEIPELLPRFMENIGYDVLERIIRNDQTIRHGNRAAEAPDVQQMLGGVLRKGTYQVGIALFRSDGGRVRYSMAHRGFRRPAELVIGEGNGWLVLTPCQMMARSRIDGELKEGRLGTLKYYREGRLTAAEETDGRIWVPLDACKVQKSGKGNIKAVIPVTVTCTVGNADMPESTAVLMFWM